MLDNQGRISSGSSADGYAYLVQSQGSNIQRYSNYLMARAKTFGDTQMDFVRSGPGRLKRLTVDKGLLRETESVQKQIRAILKCDVGRNEMPSINGLAC